MSPLLESAARAALLGAAPLLLMQGRSVRRRALRLPEAPGERSGGSFDSEGGVRLLILGDSSAAGVGVPDQSVALSGQLLRRLDELGVAPARWRLVARTGVRAADLIGMLDESGLTESAAAAHEASTDGSYSAPQARFDLAVIAIGVNDVTGATPLSRWVASLDALHSRLQALGVRQTVFSGLPPMGRFPALPQPLRSYLGLQARRYDRALAQWAGTRPGISHLPLASADDPGLLAADGFHPGEAGCALWAGQLVSRFRQPRHVASGDLLSGQRAF